MVGFQPGTLLWVKCDDGEWWPAVAREMDTDSLLVAGGGCDMCVEFHHDPGNLYPVESASAGVRVLHRAKEERDATEEGFFRAAATQEAVKRALLDDVHGGAPAEEGLPPYSPEELRCMSALLDSINHTTASQLRKTLLAREGIDLSSRNIRQQMSEKDRRRRKRHTRRAEGIELPPDDAKVVPEAELDARTTETAEVVVSRVGEAEWSFQEAFDPSALDMLRKEVFENKERFVLSPLYRYLDLLGAVAVDGVSVETTLPTPRALHEVPEEGLLESRRVLLVALSASSFEHTVGWMVPFEYEGTTIAMTLSVNGTAVETPCNCSLPSGKEAVAVKTATVADITTHLLHKDLFSLAVGFTGQIEDAALWKGVIAAVYVDLVDIEALADRIVSNYKMPPRRKGRDDVVGVQVKITCPITTLPLHTPVRGFFVRTHAMHGTTLSPHALCAHECVELSAVLGTNTAR
ncbi:lorien protein [Trypanosoma conorhini]|uniref:Lorien protein n=1 Tax=Trypanosoma conorhini TaxID=83891 RepID=A0A3R7NSG3_9TRYP|nr:lorien protein [Trypanosoma conorhini]RNF06974.1 lorien protein [Trypanosoma conorhini]